jgi:hypothetical protein
MWEIYKVKEIEWVYFIIEQARADVYDRPFL